MTVTLGMLPAGCVTPMIEAIPEAIAPGVLMAPPGTGTTVTCAVPIWSVTGSAGSAGSCGSAEPGGLLPGNLSLDKLSSLTQGDSCAGWYDDLS